MTILEDDHDPDHDDLSGDSLSDFADEGDDKDGDSQFSHKKIPSWQEAIESVVATNMASRANNPGGGSRGRGRGRRDR